MGLLDILTKDEAPQQIIEAILAVAKGDGRWLSEKTRSYFD